MPCLLHARISVKVSNFITPLTFSAAAEGNIVAMRILVEFGADLTVTDRWGHTAEMEAESANAGLVLKFLQTLKEGRDEEPGATADD
jgi:ankyrin repeat protein